MSSISKRFRKIFTENSQGSAIHLSSDGRFVYAGNRGHDSIAVFAAGPDGKLSLVEYTSTEGSWPRDLCLTRPKNLSLPQTKNRARSFYTPAIRKPGSSLCCKKDVPVPEAVCVKFLHG
jgi:6-phosphogluconolactonase